MLDDLFSLSQAFLRVRNRDFKRYFLRDHSLNNRFSVHGTEEHLRHLPQLEDLASGSSALETTKGSHDLSRRALVYRMHGMSFREYIGMNFDLYFDHLSLDAIVNGHQQAADTIVVELEKKGLKVLALFKEYLACGYYPYYGEYGDKTQFYMTLEQNIHTTLESDLQGRFSRG